MKNVRIFLLAITLLVVFGLGGWYLALWMTSRAFQSAAEEGDFQKLFAVVEASVGGKLATGDLQLQRREILGDGAFAFYQKNPEALQRDRKYFETWSSALAIAEAGREREHETTSRWESSARLGWIAPTHRTDSWGHAFCVESDQKLTIVMSPGPLAVSSLDCDSLKLSQDELSKMSQGTLNLHSSGALILFVKTVSTGVSGGRL